MRVTQAAPTGPVDDRLSRSLPSRPSTADAVANDQAQIQSELRRIEQEIAAKKAMLTQASVPSAARALAEHSVNTLQRDEEAKIRAELRQIEQRVAAKKAGAPSAVAPGASFALADGSNAEPRQTSSQSSYGAPVARAAIAVRPGASFALADGSKAEPRQTSSRSAYSAPSTPTKEEIGRRVAIRRGSFAFSDGTNSNSQQTSSGQAYSTPALPPTAADVGRRFAIQKGSSMTLKDGTDSNFCETSSRAQPQSTSASTYQQYLQPRQVQVAHAPSGSFAFDDGSATARPVSTASSSYSSYAPSLLPATEPNRFDQISALEDGSASQASYQTSTQSYGLGANGFAVTREVTKAEAPRSTIAIVDGTSNARLESTASSSYGSYAPSVQVSVEPASRHDQIAVLKDGSSAQATYETTSRKSYGRAVPAAILKMAEILSEGPKDSLVLNDGSESLRPQSTTASAYQRTRLIRPHSPVKPVDNIGLASSVEASHYDTSTQQSYSSSRSSGIRSPRSTDRSSLYMKFLGPKAAKGSVSYKTTSGDYSAQPDSDRPSATGSMHATTLSLADNAGEPAPFQSVAAQSFCAPSEQVEIVRLATTDRSTPYMKLLGTGAAGPNMSTNQATYSPIKVQRPPMSRNTVQEETLNLTDGSAPSELSSSARAYGGFLAEEMQAAQPAADRATPYLALLSDNSVPQATGATTNQLTYSANVGRMPSPAPAGRNQQASTLALNDLSLKKPLESLNTSSYQRYTNAEVADSRPSNIPDWVVKNRVKQANETRPEMTFETSTSSAHGRKPDAVAPEPVRDLQASTLNLWDASKPPRQTTSIAKSDYRKWLPKEVDTVPNPARGIHVPADRLNLSDGTKANVRTSTARETFSIRQDIGSSRPGAQLRVEEDGVGTIAGRPKDEWELRDGTDTTVKTSTTTEAFARRWAVTPPRPPAQEETGGAWSQDAQIHVSRPKDEWRLEDASAPTPPRVITSDETSHDAPIRVSRPKDELRLEDASAPPPRGTTSDETYRRSERPSSIAAPTPTYGTSDESWAAPSRVPRPKDEWVLEDGTACPGGGGEAGPRRPRPRPPPARYPAMPPAPAEVRSRPSLSTATGTGGAIFQDISAPSYKPAVSAVKSFNWRKYLPKGQLGSGLGVKGEASLRAVGQPVTTASGDGQKVEDPNATRRRRHAEKQGNEMLKDYMAGGMGVAATEPAQMRASSLGSDAGRTAADTSADMYTNLRKSPHARKTTLVPKRTFGAAPPLASKYFSQS